MFGGPSHRYRVPPSRENPPFGAFNRSHQPTNFPGREWDEEAPFQRASSPNMHKPAASAPSTNRERIIPIQIVGTSSPPPPEPLAHHTAPEAQTQPVPPTRPIVLGGPKEVTGEAGDKKYNTQPHNTTDNVKLTTPGTEKQRAKSEPPLQYHSSGTGTPPTKGTEAPTPPTHDEPKPSGIGMTQFGGSQSKNKGQENGGSGAGGCRNIPIIVEGRKSGGAPPANKGQPTQIPQKNRFQPDHCEPSTTPPPPPKKVTRDTIQIIQEIVDEVHNLENEVNALPPTPKTAKNYIYLDEMLTRNLIKLDTIETEGKEDIRLARRDCIKLIQKVISMLEGKSSETALVPFSGNNAAPSEASLSDSTALVPLGQIDLALTPTSSVTSPVLVSAEAAMEICPTTDTSNPALSPPSNAVDEAMSIEEKVTA